MNEEQKSATAGIVPFEQCIDELVAFEHGQLDVVSVVRLFQCLIDNGAAWRLQGSYGRIAKQLIDAGHCQFGPIRQTDFYGNTVPSRFDVNRRAPCSATRTDQKQTSEERRADS